MKTYLTLAAALALAACTTNAPAPAGVANVPGSSQGQLAKSQPAPGVAKPGQAPSAPAQAAAQEQPASAFPLSINGPDGKTLVVIQADGTFQGDAGKLAKLLGVQKGGLPQENVLMALVLHALREDAGARPKVPRAEAPQPPTGG